MDDRQIIEYLTSRSWIQPQSEGGCWLFQDFINRDGYGQFTLYKPRKRTAYAHRESLRAHGYDVEGLSVDHLCANKNCWNPLHLELVTLAENTSRAANKRWGIYRRLHALTINQEVKVTK
ncbi:HNH endonuclease [Micromonospora purpureochromogenes]|uniref:HNH endonuclease n=1 Tax=Micromonospora purpureochromogenes TaxID=47872 RepID=UPI0033CC53DB